MTVRRFGGEEKRTIGLAYLSGVRMADLCREHQVTSPTVYGWRDRFLDGGLKALEGDTPSKRGAALDRGNARPRRGGRIGRCMRRSATWRGSGRPSGPAASPRWCAAGSAAP